MKTTSPWLRTTFNRWRRLSALLLATACLANPAWSGPVAFKEYEIKAAFLIRFTEFVDWPVEAFPEADTPITIGVYGQDVFGEVLDRATETTTVKNRKFVIKRSRRVEDLKKCHIVFISRQESAQVVPVLTGLKGGCVLTVGEAEGFADKGGLINFFVVGKNVRFEINLDAARQAGLKISSDLLQLGKLVGRDPTKENP